MKHYSDNEEHTENLYTDSSNGNNASIMTLNDINAKIKTTTTSATTNSSATTNNNKNNNCNNIDNASSSLTVSGS